ncbi:hypothetical protein IJT10_02870 [bacterium]|nr:hypothetical protein [bacterium]
MATAREILQNLPKSNFYKESLVPMGYTAGLPILHVVGQRTALILPYLRYKITGRVDKTLVFPPRYIFTVEIPSGIVVAFEDLCWQKRFAKVNFSKPVGIFRHEAIRDMDKGEYKQKRLELLDLADSLLASARCGERPLAREEENFRKIYNILLEPSLEKFYRVIAPDFFRNYLD